MEPKLFEDLEPEPKIILIKHLLQSGWSSVVDPNTLNLDPDPGFWPRAICTINFDRKKIKIILEKNNFL